jgi:hypothetical protein
MESAIEHGKKRALTNRPLPNLYIFLAWRGVGDEASKKAHRLPQATGKLTVPSDTKI